MEGFTIHFFELIAPYMFFLILVFSIACIVFLIFNVIRKHFKSKGKSELEQKLQEMKIQNDDLKQQIWSLKQDGNMKTEQVLPKDMNNTLVNIGSLQLRTANILYVVSQSFEQVEGGNSRIKVIHYVNSDKSDSVYTTFENLIEILPASFMMINKNQLINLNKISKIQGLSIHLEGIKNPFYISETRKDEFSKRMKQN